MAFNPKNNECPRDNPSTPAVNENTDCLATKGASYCAYLVNTTFGACGVTDVLSSNGDCVAAVEPPGQTLVNGQY